MPDNRSAREIAEEVADDELANEIFIAAHRSNYDFRMSIADAIERGIEKYLEEHR